MKTIGYFTLSVLALLIVGCSTPFRPWNLSGIQEGMSKDQVVQILGKPDSTEIKDGAEQLHYIYEEDLAPTLSAEPFSDTDTERAFRSLDTQQAFKTYEYVVILVDGKVINYKEL